MHRTARLVPLLVAGLVRPAVAAPAADRFYVAPAGRDANTGRRPAGAGADGPFVSLERARDAVRALKRGGLKHPVEVVLRAGVYSLEKPLILTPEDGGTPQCPITWRAQEGERVLLRGGRHVAGWKPWRDGIFRADLGKQGLAGIRFHQLFYRRAGQSPAAFAERQILARHPNFDPLHPRTGGNVYCAATAGKPNEQILYEEGALPFERWHDLSQAEVVSTYNLGWMFAITPIRSVDTSTRTITVRRVRGQFLKMNRFFVQNVLDALNAPGEWFLDRKQDVLYFRPPAGDPNQGEVIVPTIDHVVEVRGTIPYPLGYLNIAFKGRRDEFPLPADAPPLRPVEHLSFRGLDFECARQDAIRLTGARECRVLSCRVTNVGGIGVNLGGVTTTFDEVGNPRVTPASGRATGGAGGGGQILFLNDPCMQCRVEGCDVWSTGAEGILLLGSGNTAENNHVWDIGLYHKDAPCINLLGDANVARRNTLHDCPRCTIFIKGVDNVAELNDCHHANLETCDMGSIRMVQRNIHLRGNKIRFNRILDTIGYGVRAQQATHYESPYFTWGVYLDDYTSGTNVYGNIIARAGRGGVMIHGGGHNLVANNVVYNAGSYQIEFAPMPETHPSYKDAYQGNRAERNVLVCTGEGAVPYRFTSATPHMPVFRSNLFWAGRGDLVFITAGMLGLKGLDAWAKRSSEEGSLVADPLLSAPGKDDFRLGDGSPAWKLGFERIPIERIGCYRSPERVTWPLAPNRDRFREKPVLHAVAGYDPAKERPAAVQFLGPVREEFEDDEAGRRPLRGDVLAPTPSAITVTGEAAAGGKQCLKIEDATGLAQAWQPRIFYPTDFADGQAALSLDLRLDGGQRPSLYIDPRDYGGAGGEYVSGPMLTIHPDGTLAAGEKVLAALPFDRWIRLEVRMRLGEGAGEQSDLVLTLPGEEPRQLVVPHAGRAFRRLHRIVIASLTTERSVFYIDNVRVEATSE